MSGKCCNCNCADVTQCLMKGNSYDLVIVDTENLHFCHKLQYILRNGSCTEGTRKYLCKSVMTPLILMFEGAQNKCTMDTAAVDAPAAERDGKCKCCTGCSCVK